MHDPSEELHKELARQQTHITQLESELAEAVKSAGSTVKVEVSGPGRIVYNEKIVQKIVECLQCQDLSAQYTPKMQRRQQKIAS